MSMEKIFQTAGIKHTIEEALTKFQQQKELQLETEYVYDYDTEALKVIIKWK